MSCNLNFFPGDAIIALAMSSMYEASGFLYCSMSASSCGSSRESSSSIDSVLLLVDSQSEKDRDVSRPSLDTSCLSLLAAGEADMIFTFTHRG